MSNEFLSGTDVAEILTRSAQNLREAVNELDGLDAAIGDGDHGSSVATLFEVAVAKIDLGVASAGKLLKTFGTSLMHNCSGASGTLYAVLFTSLGTTVELDEALDLGALARGFRQGVDVVQKVGGASLGDATLVDALAPFVTVLEEQFRQNASLSTAFELAANAAASGAQLTSAMIATVGRARGFGDRSLGHVDPGARSFAIVANSWRPSH